METLAAIKETSAPILKEYGVSCARVFGSVARGTATPESDLDLVVSLKQPIGLIKFFELNNRLEDALGRKVDLATPKSLNPRLSERIEPELVTIYEG